MVQFLDRLPSDVRQRLLSLSEEVILAAGQHLIRRGEQGGDLYLLVSGGLEVVDSRQSPEVILTLIAPGELVGEMSFLDQLPRSASVRASVASTGRLWRRSVLQEALQGDLALAAAFYRGVAALVTRRVRALATTGQLVSRQQRVRVVEERVQQRAHALVSPARSRWIAAEMRARTDQGQPGTHKEMRRAFESLIKAGSNWISGMGAPEAERSAGEALSRELHPFLIQSRTAARALESAARQVGDPRLMAHILLNEPSADRPLGEAIDQVLLSLPTSVGLRKRTTLAGQTLISAMPTARCRLMVINAASGVPLARVMPALARHGGTVTCIDGSRDALAFLDAGLTSRAPSVELRLVQDDLARLSMGRSPVNHPPQDLILIDGLADYLPDRLVAALLSWSARSLAEGGRVVVTGLAPWPDAPVFDHLIQWPMIRRTARVLRALVESAGLAGGVVAGGRESRDPAVVVTGARSQGA